MVISVKYIELRAVFHNKFYVVLCILVANRYVMDLVHQAEISHDCSWAVKQLLHVRVKSKLPKSQNNSNEVLCASFSKANK